MIVMGLIGLSYYGLVVVTNQLALARFQFEDRSAETSGLVNVPKGKPAVPRSSELSRDRF